MHRVKVGGILSIMKKIYELPVLVLVAAISLAACGGGGGGGAAAGGATYTIGGTVSGLTGAGLVLQNNFSDDLTVAVNASSFVFATPLTNAASYQVAVKTQPAGQTCSVTSGTGAVSGANVTNVAITCVAGTYTVGGTVSGLAGAGLVLQNNLSDDLTVAVNATSFVFATPLAHAASYQVTVKTQPAGQTCVIASGTGAVSGANVTSISVTCPGGVGTLITAPTASPVLSFPQNIVSQDTGTVNSHGEFFPGQANVWSLDSDFTLVDGYDNQFDYALALDVISGSTSSTFFPTDQEYSELTYYTPVMGTADGVKTVVVSNGTSIVLSPLAGTYSAYLNATSDSRLQRTLDLTAATGITGLTLDWTDKVSLDSGALFGYDASYRVVLRKPDGTFLKEIPNITTSSVVPRNHSTDLLSYYPQAKGQIIVVSFEFKSMTSPWNRAFAIIDSVSVTDRLNGPNYVTNGNFETGDLTGWATNTPVEVQNITSGMRTVEGLNIKRSFYTVPNNLWARWVDVFENTTASPITRTIEYETVLGSAGAGIIYYSPGTSNKALTSWDGAAEDRDIGLVFGNAASVDIAGSSATALNTFNGDGIIRVTYNITVPANGRAALVNFVILGSTDTGQTATDINAKATEVDTEAALIMSNFWTDAQYRAGMTQQQIDAITNF